MVLSQTTRAERDALKRRLLAQRPDLVEWLRAID